LPPLPHCGGPRSCGQLQWHHANRSATLLIGPLLSCLRAPLPACPPASLYVSRLQQERYQGILQAIDSLGAELSAQSMRGTSASEDCKEGQMSPEAARIATASDTAGGHRVGDRAAASACQQ
jgi:hypothetical protein